VNFSPKVRSLFLAAATFAQIVSVSAHQFAAGMPSRDVDIPSPAAEKQSNPVVAGGMNAVVNAYKLWRAGQTLNACFVDGTNEAKQMFVNTEREWEQYVSVRWDFGAAPEFRTCSAAQPSHIRIAFDKVGHWSRVGTDSINQTVVNQPSLNIDISAFGDLRLADRQRVRGVMLHEIGHAFGFEHEHQSPQDPCIAQINWPRVYSALEAPPNSWDKAKVDQNLRALVGTDRLRTTPYDRTSIMHYSFPPDWFKDPTCAVGENNDLSASDKQEARLAYPANPDDQSKFINAVQGSVNAALTSLQVSTQDRTALAKDIESLSDKLEPRLRSGTIFAIGRDNTGIILNNVNQQSNGPCSPNVAGVQGSVNIGSDCK
jgi:hypothetical protein